MLFEFDMLILIGQYAAAYPRHCARSNPWDKAALKRILKPKGNTIHGELHGLPIQPRR